MTDPQFKTTSLRFTTQHKVYLRELLYCIEQRYGTISKTDCDTTNGLNLLVEFITDPNVNFYFEEVDCWSKFPSEVFISLESNDIFVCVVNNIVVQKSTQSINQKIMLLESRIKYLEESYLNIPEIDKKTNSLHNEFVVMKELIDKQSKYIENVKRFNLYLDNNCREDL